MRCAIMQPTYLPWSGYFNLINTVDVFVILNDVQYDRRSWQSRNRILVNGKEFMLTVPVKKSPVNSKIHEIIVNDDEGWRSKHVKTILASYKKCQGGALISELIESVFEHEDSSYLQDVNIAMIKSFCELLDINTDIVLASDLQCGGRRSKHLIEICEAIGVDTYISPLGSKEYLEEDGFENISKVGLEYANFIASPYKQMLTERFVSHLSIVDVVANCGVADAKKYIRGELRG